MTSLSVAVGILHVITTAARKKKQEKEKE